MILLMLGAATALSGATPPADRYAMGAVESDLKASRRIGSRRAGLVCLPAGNYKWSDARGALGDARKAVATVLHDRAPATVDTADDPFSDEGAATRYRFVATVTDFGLNACVRNWGLAARLRHDHALSGRAHIAVVWDVFDRTTRTRVAHDLVETDDDLAGGVEDASDALLTALKGNAAQYAQQRWPTLKPR